jgi:membrane-associated phospholipid phosphatase
MISLYVFSKMLEDVLSRESIVRLDLAVNAYIALIASPALTKVMALLTSIAGPLFMGVLSIILFAVLIYRKKKHHALFLAVAMLMGLFTELFVKIFVHRLRPENALLHVSGYSFPSGHAMMATIFFLIVAYSFKDEIKNTLLRILFVVSNIALVLVIAFSRVCLNVHWLSDVIAGFAAGMFWFTLILLMFKSYLPGSRWKSI